MGWPPWHVLLQLVVHGAALLANDEQDDTGYLPVDVAHV